VTQVVADARREGETIAASPACEVVRLPASNVLERRFGVPYPLFGPRKLAAALRKLVTAADVVHVHGMLFQNSVAALRLARREGRAARVLTEHVGHVPYGNPLLDLVEAVAIRTVGRYAARAAETIITLNPRVEALMTALAPRTPTVRIDNGVDLDRYRPPHAGEREELRTSLGWDATPRVLFVGRLVAKKGLAIALDAARLGNGAWELVVAGPGTPPEGAAHAQFLGALPPERIAALYRACDAFLLPSRGEGFPLTAQEAMASALPIVLSDDPAYSSVLDGSGAGASLVPARAETMAAAVQALLPRAHQAGQEAARFARSRFSWEQTADRHLAIYESLRPVAR
jgi:glycosyltransferase involved in cell wall biosynthesis